MVLWLLSVLAIFFLILLALLFIFQSRLVYFPSSDIEATPEDYGLEYEDVYFKTEDELFLHGWFIPADDTPRATLIFCHGNAGNISHRLESIEQFHSLGLNVFIFDYRGYGNSQGQPTEEGTYKDAQAAWNYLTGKKNISDDELIIFGRSLGGPVAAWLALNNQPRGLIIESSFTSLPELGSEIYPYLPVKYFLRIKYPTREYVRKVKVPVLIGHSIRDNLISFHHGKRLFDAAREPKYWLEMMGDHNIGFIETGDRYLKEINSFIEVINENR
ncbi:MAG: alpha/beta hydrolase [Balneolales bacterium]